MWAYIVRDQYARHVPGAPSRSRWVACRDCGLVFQNPRPSPEGIESLYADGKYRGWIKVPEAMYDYAQRRPLPILQWLERRPEIQALLTGPAERRCVLDMGCGIGGSLPQFEKRGWQAYGVEPDPMLAQAGVERFGANIIPDFMHDKIFPGVNFSLAISIHAFEHLLDPVDVARAAYNRLRATEGYLFTAVPTYVRANHWAWEWMNTAHTYLFTGPTLGNLLSEAGFEVIAWHYPWRGEHRDAGSSELWLLARARAAPLKQVAGQSVAQTAAALPFREPLWRVQAGMLSVPLHAWSVRGYLGYLHARWRVQKAMLSLRRRNSS